MKQDIKVLGLDLSGPSNIAETALACFRLQADQLSLETLDLGWDDQRLVDFVQAMPLETQVVVGLDAPLSYNLTGGDRPADSDLRRRLILQGLSSGTVMPPTLTRMAYLTLRGMAIARLLEHLLPQRLRLVETHPAGCLALRGAPIDAIRDLKKDITARQALLHWLRNQNLQGIPIDRNYSDHEVAACAAALAAWQWFQKQPTWIMPALPPHHPYDFVC